jgi:NitT/TauT family transport system ATP-binding protein
MRQRVGLARALVVHPKVLLMDEPFSALDVLTAETLRTDLLDLWHDGRMPISSILLVTHNIEEAVLMSDRILVFSSNPGRVAAEIRVELPQPRNRLDPTFRRLVDDIYALMTARPTGKATSGLFPGTGISMVLPRVSPNLLAGLMETLAAEPYRGHADLPAIAASLQMEIDDLFPVAETLQLLRFAEVAEGDIRLTDTGKRFVQLDQDERKRLFAQRVLAYVPLVQHIKRVLEERNAHTAPESRFRDELEDHMTVEHAEQTLRSVTSWATTARYSPTTKRAESSASRIRSEVVVTFAAGCAPRRYRGWYSPASSRSR